MKYIVTRASGNTVNEKKPCEEATLSKEDGHWTVELNSLDELHQFINMYGDIVVSNTEKPFKFPTITIYDAYIES